MLGKNTKPLSDEHKKKISLAKMGKKSKKRGSTVSFEVRKK
jgi:hypothetical protein